MKDKRGRNTIVIHPGSRWLRIGRASDILPVSVPNVIARRKENPRPPVPFYGIRRPKPARPDENDDMVEEKIQEEDEEMEDKPPAEPEIQDEGEVFASIIENDFISLNGITFANE